MILASQAQINVLGRTKYFNRQIWQIHEVVASGLMKSTWTGTRDMDSDMGTKALMGSNFDRVSNRSFSRMYEQMEVKSVASKPTVVKATPKSVDSSAKPKTLPKIPINAKVGGSANNNNNTATSASSESIPDELYSKSACDSRSKIAAPKRGGPTGRSRPADDDDDDHPGKLGGGK